MPWVIVPAAGVGRRFGAERPKQYAQIEGRPLLHWTLTRLAQVAQVDGLMVVLAAHDPWWSPDLALGKPVLTTVGGAERADSVLAGLRELPASVGADDLVLVHDAARPCVRASDIERLLAAVAGHDGGLLATPVRDTLKRSDALDEVAETVPRAGLWRALTPQVFRRGPLMQALDEARQRGLLPTDEAQAMEARGIRPRLVEGAEDNIKVTTAHDLNLVRFLLKSQGEDPRQ